MRRNDREIKNFEEIADIFKRADTVRVGINAVPFPYVVPLSFGFEALNGKITIYVHGAMQGYKHDLLRSDNNVCVEADIFHGYARIQNGVTVEYESVIGFGKAEPIFGAEAEKGLAALLGHCGFDGFACGKTVLDKTLVYKIELTEITGKRRFV
ncbi:MAG: pyridoxamine 5'-phosphate oxidase family protein [Clostridiales bacterium]|jgi:nitroimidazol reductase NimA-like FMN-containing flavoprotein (pyridoxamine 5'-phosphate oxidase superfamily)|nr:pyridoxamine 5'-phosphate oxidase family protein [Clostridiales bacterium]